MRLLEFYDGFTNLKLLAEVRHVISDQQIRDCMRRLGLNPDDHTKVKNYSAGMKQKLGIAQAVMENQTIVLLDEPFNALDFQTNAEIFSMLKQLKEEKKTVLLTSHQQDFLEKVCDELYIILNKKLVPFTEEIRRSYFSLFGNGT
ncbi:MAG: ATP-binding cassette domain-containing protein [Lachnospiraceae bacterium]